jgi:hypothetical protein
MNGAVVAIVSAFFIIGITVGIIAVVAMSVLRADRPRDPGDLPEFGLRRPGQQPPEAGWDDAGPDDRPRWPGGVSNGFSSE